jgi:hypothetical protein
MATTAKRKRMTRKTIHALVAIIVGLALLLMVLRSDDLDDTMLSGKALLPNLKAVANDVTEIRLRRPAEDEAVTLLKRNGKWVVGSRDDYAADLARLRQLIIALADAEVVEEKTSNPELYAKLSVGDPEDGGTGTKVSLTGSDFSYDVILGNTAQGKNRYARVAGEATSYLVNQNPELPPSAGDWLAPVIVDLDAGDVRRVVISHADDETITIEKTEKEQTDFDVSEVPEGRELSYATVGNGIAGALAKLELDDVRIRVEAPAVTTTVYETWNGLRVTADIVSDEETSWISLSAELANGESGASEKAAEINERVSGWQYRIADHKKNLLTRRWDDILRSTEE